MFCLSTYYRGWAVAWQRVGWVEGRGASGIWNLESGVIAAPHYFWLNPPHLDPLGFTLQLELGVSFNRRDIIKCVIC